MKTLDRDKRARIRHLNDLLRCRGIGGQVMITVGLDALGEEKVKVVIREVAAFTTFTPDNDPYGEHDCVLVTVGELRIIWKIDYFDLGLIARSSDPSDASQTSCVMTFMLAHEY
jgi:Protein of unknown function (DUF3768)